MSMDKDTVYKVARLGRLKVSEKEADMFADQLGGILDWINLLDEIKTDNVEPLATPSEIAPKTRMDAVNDGNLQVAVLANAPEEQQGYFVVPKIIEQQDGS